MNSDWMIGAREPEEKQKRKEMVQSARPTLDLLKSILERKLEGTYKELMDKQGYDMASWSQMQADRVGQARTLQEIIKLLTLDRETQ